MVKTGGWFANVLKKRDLDWLFRLVSNDSSSATNRTMMMMIDDDDDEDDDLMAWIYLQHSMEGHSQK